MSRETASRYGAIAVACVATVFSLVGRSRVWLHSTGRLHIWYHLILFGVLGAFAVGASRRMLWRVMWIVLLLGLGLAMETWEARGSLAAIEWADVQADCWGVGFGCLAVWVLSGGASRGHQG